VVTVIKDAVVLTHGVDVLMWWYHLSSVSEDASGSSSPLHVDATLTDDRSCEMGWRVMEFACIATMIIVKIFAV
jgi:hypothetical protein